MGVENPESTAACGLIGRAPHFQDKIELNQTSANLKLTFWKHAFARFVMPSEILLLVNLWLPGELLE